MKTYEYRRDLAVEYAHRWANGRNPRYLDFEKFGGDCTNFASQCLFEGSDAMNYIPNYGLVLYKCRKQNTVLDGS